MQLLEIAQAYLWYGFVVFLRVGPMIALFPGIGEQSVPLRVRLMLSLAFTAAVSPVVIPHLGELRQSPDALVLLILAETAIGSMIGIGIRLFLLSLQTAGSIMAQSTSLAQILGNSGLTPLPAIGHVLVTGALALAMILGLHVRLAELAVTSYEIFPPARLPDAAGVSTWGIERISHAFGFAFTLAGPFLLVSLLYNLTLGIVNRAMPQLMVVFVGAPAISAGTLLLLAVLAPPVLAVWVAGFADFLANPFGGR